jgi:hypothetical protein
MVLNALPNGSFSVTLDDVDGSNELTAVLLLRTSGGPGIKMRFPTAQEFDVVLRDEDGNPVWRWSDDLAFEQASHERSISVEWTIAVPLPRPKASELQPRNYTLHAWLTTEGPAPQYAATVPVSIAPLPAQ